ncbi:MAG: hypothetical protein DRG83_03275 [Deltaproteobacteria bacterium]|nr:MAG: hypothetical protein DRG83_03275 [Deltaproteobacteria bacterium]
MHDIETLHKNLETQPFLGMLKKKIIVVDDDPQILDTVIEALQKHGYFVKGASGAGEAQAYFEKEHFDLLIVDLEMEEMNGLELFRLLHARYPDLQGIMITGCATIDASIRALEEGFSNFLLKPFKVNDLLRAVEKSLSKKQIDDENTRLKTLIPLYKLGRKFLKAQTIDELLEELIKTVKEETRSDRVSVMLIDEETGELSIRAAIGLSPEIVKRVRIKPGQNIAGWVLQNGKPLILNGGPEDHPQFSKLMKLAEIKAAISYPLVKEDQVFGVLNVSKLVSGEPFSPADVELLSVICDQAVMAFDNLRLIKEISEKVRAQTLLQQFVAPHVAQALLSQKEDIYQYGEIKELIILFADIRNFTPMVQEMMLGDVRVFLNEFFDAVCNVVFKYDGTIIKFMGDALIAVFGAPIKMNQPGLQALKASREMLKTFEDIRERWASKSKFFERVGLGIGLTKGEVFIGNIGSSQKIDYTVVGTAVNMAQRLAGEATAGQILLTPEVKKELGNHDRLVASIYTKLKGFKNSQRMYALTFSGKN